MTRTHSLYTLDDNRNPQPEHDALRWAKWFETTDRQVAYDVSDGICISTVFIGVNMQIHVEQTPALWETAIFGFAYAMPKNGKLNDGPQERYTSHDAAVTGHARWVERVKKNIL